ncbi:hypothetical protein AWC38_SpisGene22140 [Stylophora pistillata]|uniref:Reverse transcriptase zinc-binding domain-containing protein n=1 Tax=Stylophora pistillata TaxID=50429 RepID=A0A2B4R7X6_STYPI|nr:hypothetical protein AWC38_SpisGene22140 [Stylophora pistillata]
MERLTPLNTLAVSLLRYGAGIIGWTKEELKALDRVTRKVLTMNDAFHPNSDVDRLYMSRVNGGRGLISCEGCVRSEVNSLGWYVKNSEEGLLQGVRATSVIRSEGTVSKEEFKTSWNNEQLNNWKDKTLHGQFVREIPETTHVGESWSWLRKADLKIQTEEPIRASQEQAIRTNYVKYHIDKTVESPLCGLCGEKCESVNHIVCEYKKLAQREYKRRHDNVARAVHWKLCEKYHLDKKDKWYEHAPDSETGSTASRLIREDEAMDSENKLNVPLPRTNYYRKSFSYNGATLWNSLPSDIRNTESLGLFKRKLEEKIHSTMMDKLGPLREVLVQKDDDWEEWGLEELVENLPKYVERNPLRTNQDIRTKDESQKARPWKKDREKEKMLFRNKGRLKSN